MSGHGRRKASVEVANESEAASALEAERARARKQMPSKEFPVTLPMPEVAQWKMGREDVEKRRKMHTLHGPSRTG
eukprot:9046732-Pyramimonas_sp.AAC.1